MINFRTVTIGDSSVGKTSIVNRILWNEFDHSEASTIGASYELYSEIRNGEKIELQIWDTAGQEEYRSLAPLYFRNSNGAMLVFDISKKSTFESANYWYETFQSVVGSSFVVVLIGNKADLDNEREVSKEEAEEWASAHNCRYFEASALTGFGIKNALKVFIDGLLQSRKAPSVPKVPAPITDNKQNSGCC